MFNKALKYLLYYVLVMVCFYTIISAKAYSANHRIDSLLKVLPGQTADTNRVKTLNRLSSILASNNEGEKAIPYAKEAIELSKKLNFKEGIAISYSTLASAYRKIGNHTLAIDCYEKATLITKELKDTLRLINLYNKQGVIYWRMGLYTQAVERYFSSLKVAEQLKDTGSIANALGNIGLVYMDQKKIKEALDYTNKSLDYFIKIKNKKEIAASYTNLGNLYTQIGNHQLAYEYYKKALPLKREVKDKEGEVIVMINICVNSLDKNSKEIETLSDTALIMAKEINSKFHIVELLKVKGIIAGQKKKYTVANNYLQEAVKIALQIDAYDLIKSCYRELTQIDSASGSWKEAYLHQANYMRYNEMIFNEENSVKISQQQMLYEFDKKEASQKAEQETKDALSKAELKKQTMQRNGFVIGFLLMLTLTVMIFRSYSNKKKANQIITAQKQEVENQKYIIEGKHKEITDSINYAERIQRSFLATEEHLKENLKEYFIFFKPKDIVSGDFYWSATLNNNHFILATADSTGHGVPGAIMSLLNITSLEKAIETNSQPNEILNVTRKIIIERLKKDGTPEGGKDGMDCSLCVYDFANKKLFVSAANNPVWIARQIISGQNEESKTNYQIVEVKPDKMPVGKHDKQDIPFTLHEINLQKGDVIYALTDGFSDQFGGEKNKKFMSKNLRELLANNAHLPMHEQKHLLEKIFINWVGNIEQIDDVTIIGVRV
ncbi:MAG: tetratricopeptide repeat protein [Bacteroidia bacterium]|nr:tetratricopeptide repeat protein [Bacteroidia bacterium]